MDRGNRQRYGHFAAVLSTPHRFEVVDAIALSELPKHLVFFAPALLRNDRTDRAADHFFGGISKDTFGPSVPGLDRTFEILADDGIVRGFNDGGEHTCEAIL